MTNAVNSDSPAPDKEAFAELDRTVVAGGYCVGCGVCAGMFPDALAMTDAPGGVYVPRVVNAEADTSGVVRLCPFSADNAVEDDLARGLFGQQPGAAFLDGVGWYLQCFAGHVAREDDRLRSASGGLISWLLRDLLKRGEVRAVACVAPTASPNPLFAYRIAHSLEELEGTQKSRYYPVEMSAIIPEIRRLEGKVAVTGVPCFIKGLRLACQHDPELARRVACTVGLFCGHLKSKNYAAYLSRCLGFNEKQVHSVDFRKKLPGGKASAYAFEATARVDGREETRHVPVSETLARNWSYNLFMLRACDFCDDVLAETADIAVGDAWLDEYVGDWRGTSVVVVRRRDLLDRLREAVEAGELVLDPLPADKARQSQAGGLRHRRQGLAYRLHLTDRSGVWRPQKRVRPDKRPFSLFFRLIQRIRLRLCRRSHEAFLMQQAGGDGADVFHEAMRPLVKLHNRLYHWRSRMNRIMHKLRFGR